VDEGLPIAYPVLESDVPCYDAHGHEIGRVDHVISAPHEDIFHGIIIKTDHGPRFVAAEHVASLHERGVDLRLTASEAAELPEPGGGAPAWSVHEPGSKPNKWARWKDAAMLHDPNKRNWDEEN
jgi:hypothetical protein